MKQIKEILEAQVKELITEQKIFRYQVYLLGGGKKTKTVGMAYKRAGQEMFTLRIWTFFENKYCLLPNKNDPSAYIVMTREENKSQTSRNKYFWNIVGNAKTNLSEGALEISFDLFEKKIFMSLYPEFSSMINGRTTPEIISNVA